MSHHRDFHTVTTSRRDFPQPVMTSPKMMCCYDNWHQQSSMTSQEALACTKTTVLPTTTATTNHRGHLPAQRPQCYPPQRPLLLTAAMLGYLASAASHPRQTSPLDSLTTAMFGHRQSTMLVVDVCDCSIQYLKTCLLQR